MAAVRLIRGSLVLDMRIAPYGDGPDSPILSGRYIPMTREERDDYLDAKSGQKPSRRMDLLAEQIGRRVLAWDIPDADPKKPDDVKAVPPVFLDGIEAHLIGYAVSEQAVADLGKSMSPPS